MSFPSFDKKAVVTGVTGAIILTGVLLARPDRGADQDAEGLWPSMGRDLANSRSQPSEDRIGLANVNRLTAKWVFTTGGDVSATPTVAGNAVYFPDWGGNLYAVERNTGQLLWSHRVSDYNHRANTVSRVSPAVEGDSLIIGDNVATSAAHDGAHVMAVNRNTGELLWITTVDDHLAAIITGSPVVYGNTVYVGVSSAEEGLASNDAYPCCTFRGSVVALNAATGAILWKTYMVPPNGGQPGGYSGNAVWQPPAIDPDRGSLYIGTGNNYTVPAAVLQCQADAEATGNVSAVCTAPDDYFDTALALDLATGAVKWSKRLSGFDTWTVACLTAPKGVNCPNPAGPDFDLSGSGPNLVGGVVGFGAKSGIYTALNPANGNLLWATIVGPGGTLGGIEWGTATDGARIYAAITNNAHTSYQLQPNGPTIDWGSWAALDVRTGRILWQVADPTQGALDMGSVSVANGVLYAGSYSGAMYALNTLNGAVLWSFASGGSVLDGPSIVNGTVYWGSGYAKIRPGIANNKVYAFSLPNGGGDRGDDR
jgi:polyvinyl alcohol dehydrogenase (cytochrome)